MYKYMLVMIIGLTFSIDETYAETISIHSPKAVKAAAWLKGLDDPELMQLGTDHENDIDEMLKKPRLVKPGGNVIFDPEEYRPIIEKYKGKL